VHEPSARFPKSARILKHASFQTVYQTGGRHFSPLLTAFYVLAPSETPSTDRLRRLLSWAWEPLASTALVVVVMIFALLRILRAQGMDARHI